MSDNAISFRDIPKTSKLFQDFLYDFDRVAEFYDGSGHSNAKLAERARRITNDSYPRTEIADALQAHPRCCFRGRHMRHGAIGQSSATRVTGSGNPRRARPDEP